MQTIESVINENKFTYRIAGYVTFGAVGNWAGFDFSGLTLPWPMQQLKRAYGYLRWANAAGAASEQLRFMFEFDFKQITEERFNNPTLGILGGGGPAVFTPDEGGAASWLRFTFPNIDHQFHGVYLPANRIANVANGIRIKMSLIDATGAIITRAVALNETCIYNLSLEFEQIPTEID
jgi:hypothetical protein